VRQAGMAVLDCAGVDVVRLVLLQDDPGPT
jgi:hypothetical protein